MLNEPDVAARAAPHARPSGPKAALAALAALAAAAAFGAMALAADVQAAPAPPPAEAGVPVGDLGIELLGIKLTADNFMIDLRYRITDATKSRSLIDRNVRPVLVDEASGYRFYVPNTPKVGPLRQVATNSRPVQVGKVYFMLFANPDRRLKVGQKVTLHAGDAVLKDLEVH